VIQGHLAETLCDDVSPDLISRVIDASPHCLATPHLRAAAFGLRLLPTCSAEDLHLQSRVPCVAHKSYSWPPCSAAALIGPATQPSFPTKNSRQGAAELHASVPAQAGNSRLAVVFGSRLR
jgi:hypothetical protein